MASTLSTVAGAIPVVGSIASTLINNANTNSANAANRAFQEQQQLQQEAYNDAEQKKLEQYNSPQEQMDRDKAAGLNPNLIYGGGAGSVSGNVLEAPKAVPVSYTAQPKHAPDFGAVGSAAVNAINATTMTGAQTDNLAAQAANTQEDTILKLFQEMLDKATTSKTDAETGLVPHQAGLLDSSSQKNTVDAANTSTLMPFNADMLKANTDKARAEAQFSLSDNERQTALASATVAEAVSKIALNRVQALALKSGIQLNSSQIDKISAEINSINAETPGKASDSLLKMHGVQPGDNIGFRAVAQVINSIDYSKLLKGVTDFHPVIKSSTDHMSDRTGLPINSLFNR